MDLYTFLKKLLTDDNCLLGYAPLVGIFIFRYYTEQSSGTLMLCGLIMLLILLTIEDFQAPALSRFPLLSLRAQGLFFCMVSRKNDIGLCPQNYGN
jgi:hypothetical protein